MRRCSQSHRHSSGRWTDPGGGSSAAKHSMLRAGNLGASGVVDEDPSANRPSAPSSPGAIKEYFRA